MTDPRFLYKLILSDPKSHLAEIELLIEGLGAPFLDLQMPVWTPGSYLVREFARHVQEFEARSDGGRLVWMKISKDTWRVLTEGRLRIFVRYKVYCNDFTVRTSHLDDTHGFFNGASLFFDIAGHSHRPYDVEIAPPGQWRVSTALEKIGTRRYRAQNFDLLIDCPIEVGSHEVIPFEAANVPHELVLYSEFPVDGRRLARDIAPFVDQAVRIFGAPPYKRYIFFVHLAPGLRGGLEHGFCNVSQGDPRVFENRELYVRFLELLAHEFFHTWNVKRMRPAAFHVFDYRQETYTRLLWVFEGLTSYYELLLLARAGLVSQKEFLGSLVREIDELARTPGRRLQSLEQASFDTWIKYYRPDENSRNSSVSYYIKGCVVGCLLDLELRRRSAGRVSLDDVMVAMWRRFQSSGEGIEEEGFEALVAEILGEPLEGFFSAYVHGTEEIRYNPFFATVGLELVPADNGERKDGGSGPKGFLGTVHDVQGARVRVKEVFADTPAAGAGLSAGDELVALDGRRIESRSFEEWIAAKKPGTEVKLHVFRRDRLRELAVRLGEAPPLHFELRPLRGATDAQRNAFRLWSGLNLEPAAGSAAEGGPGSGGAAELDSSARRRGPGSGAPSEAAARTGFDLQTVPARDEPRPEPPH